MLRADVEQRQVKCLNNGIESDHAPIKKLVVATGGFKIRKRAWSTIQGFESLHYSFTIHDDIVTQQDLRDKKHWAELASNQHKTLESIIKSYASDVALKYQLHYQETVKAQALLANELLSAVDQELEKTLHFQLGINKEGSRLFNCNRSMCFLIFNLQAYRFCW